MCSSLVSLTLLSITFFSVPSSCVLCADWLLPELHGVHGQGTTSSRCHTYLFVLIYIIIFILFFGLFLLVVLCAHDCRCPGCFPSRCLGALVFVGVLVCVCVHFCGFSFFIFLNVPCDEHTAAPYAPARFIGRGLT